MDEMVGAQVNPKHMLPGLSATEVPSSYRVPI